jgi:hypothetical protein
MFVAFRGATVGKSESLSCLLGLPMPQRRLNGSVDMTSVLSSDREGTQVRGASL